MLETIKKWILFWFISSCTILLISIAYATIAPVNWWDTLTAAKFNEVINATSQSWEISAFYLSSCPTSWIPADWTNGTPDLRGAFIRWLNGNINNRDTVRSLWNFQEDAFQGHFHENAFSQSFVTAWGISVASTSFIGSSQLESSRVSGTRTNYITDLVNGTPRVSTESRPKNITLLYCMKQ
jgi:hypothetical protein